MRGGHTPHLHPGHLLPSSMALLGLRVINLPLDQHPPSIGPGGPSPLVALGAQNTTTAGSGGSHRVHAPIAHGGHGYPCHGHRAHVAHTDQVAKGVAGPGRALRKARAEPEGTVA